MCTVDPLYCWYYNDISTPFFCVDEGDRTHVFNKQGTKVLELINDEYSRDAKKMIECRNASILVTKDMWRIK